jgi:hypothetical protein
MKNLFIVITLLISLQLFNSCKEEVKSPIIDKDVESIEESKPELVTIYMDYEASQKGELTAVFSKIEVENDIAVYKVSKNVEVGKNNFKVAMFGDYVASLIQIEFGRKEIAEFKLNSLKIVNGDLTINVAKEELESYFYINKFINYDKNTGIIKTQKVGKSLAPIITIKKGIINKIYDL